MKNYTSEAHIQGKSLNLPILSKFSAIPKYIKNQLPQIDKPSTPQAPMKLPFLSLISDEPTNIRKVLYYKPKISAKS